MKLSTMLATGMLGGQTYQQRVMQIPGLIDYFPLSETGATFVGRKSGLVGTFKGTIDAKGQLWPGGYYADFSNGFGDLYTAGFLSAFDPNEFSLNFFIRPDAWNIAANQYLVHLYVDASNYIRVASNSTGTLESTWRAGAVTETNVVGNNCWPVANFQMITVTASKSANSLRLMVNGEDNPFMRDTMAGTWAGAFGSNTCGICGYRGSTFTLSYVGQIANLAIFNRAITEDEARRLLISPLPVITGIGDSILQYTSRSSWIQGIAQTRGCRVVNHGYAGTSIMGASNGMDAQTIAAAGDGASIIILEHGTNDTDESEAVTTKYAANIAALKVSNPGATIYGMGILNKTDETHRTAVNARIAAACTAQSITYWDTDGWITPATDTGDGVHPNDSGAAKIMTQILARL